jgi:hypothetical protein
MFPFLDCQCLEYMCETHGSHGYSLLIITWETIPHGQNTPKLKKKTLRNSGK